MTEGGTDLRILKPKDSNEISTDVRGTKRKLDITRDIGEDVEIQRFEHPSAPKRRRHSKDGVVGTVKKSITRVYECKFQIPKKISSSKYDLYYMFIDLFSWNINSIYV